MKGIEQIIAMTEQYVKQLEGLQHTKNAPLALRLQGAIDALIQVMEISASAWNTRVDNAMIRVTQDVPEALVMDDKIPDSLRNLVSPGALVK